jgi:hypothetical protein
MNSCRNRWASISLRESNRHSIIKMYPGIDDPYRSGRLCAFDRVGPTNRLPGSEASLRHSTLVSAFALTPVLIGCTSSRLVAKGYGLTRPVAPNTTPAGKALNRHVELLRL